MKSGAQVDQAGWGGKTSRRESWAQFDALPVGVKRLFWNAPYEYTARPAFEAFAAGANMREAVQSEARAMERDLQREALRLYGPDHPQAAG